MRDNIGLVISSPRLFGIARDAVWVEATAAKDRGLTAVLLSAASLEALVNEVTCEAEIEVRLARAEGPLEPLLEVLEAFVEAMSEAERSRGSTQLKYIIASRVLGGPVHRRGATLPGFRVTDGPAEHDYALASYDFSRLRGGAVATSIWSCCKGIGSPRPGRASTPRNGYLSNR